MKATPGEKVLEHGKVKYIVYTNKNKDETMTVRVIIDKLFKLSDMDDLKIVFLLDRLPIQFLINLYMFFYCILFVQVCCL